MKIQDKIYNKRNVFNGNLEANQSCLMFDIMFETKMLKKLLKCLVTK